MACFDCYLKSDKMWYNKWYTNCFKQIFQQKTQPKET